ncbi:xanthine dehydrogenase family protein molybdopterin-binding subunit [Cesiribacter sp. SM1]|uniref:xanthine dehydrogenase family protein molybdopterin-binding subunit n=1 Tax=Cesiribacter sp. SM1 TaxID=2861196 RepID=UPI001CD54E1C|nr:xanthine dehydrogenase family protein molybdopterin-binding subunit [Cesiribacter sp. SM1]
MRKVVMGDRLDRVEGQLKVTGVARYAAEYNLPGVAHGVLVTSSIPRGRISKIDTKAAERAPGVLAVVTHENAPEVPGYEASVNNEGSRVYGQEFRLFYDDKILHNFQPVALVVADTYERAVHGAFLVSIGYEKELHNTSLRDNLDDAFTPADQKDHKRGRPDAYKEAPVLVEQEYHTPIQVHNPMETHSTTALWEGDKKVKVYNKTQATKISQKEISKAFDLEKENVEAHSPFVGGAFGSSSRLWPQEMAAIMGAKVTGRPVKVMLMRDQVFNMVGYRPASVQYFSVGATAEGKLLGIAHHARGFTSRYEQFTERLLDPTKSMYSCPNMDTSYKLVSLDMSTPCWTRGPGETSGSFALESAMDELAYALKMDPLELRKINYAEKDPENDKPWSSNYLLQCYERGAERFGWSRRNPEPRSMREGEWLVGLGMASGIYKAARDRAEARVKLLADGSVLLRSAVADVGPGSATIFTQIAADRLGLPMEKVRFEWGNSVFPYAPGQFGSHTTASVGSAVYEVCTDLKQRLQELAVNQPGSPLYGAQAADLFFEGNTLKTKTGNASLRYADVLELHALKELEVSRESRGGPELDEFSSKSFCANFVEVRVHAATGEVRVAKVVSAVDAGKIMNHKTAESQVYGSVVWGIGIALMEEGIIDHRFGRHLNNDLADYHVPINADVPDIDVIFTDLEDPIVDPMGAKGIGEIPLIGFTAAIANAVYHATGKRITKLPITPDKLL